MKELEPSKVAARRCQGEGGKKTPFLQTNAQTNASHKFSQRLKPYFWLCTYITDDWWFIKSWWGSLFSEMTSRWDTGGARISSGSIEHFHVTQRVWPITQHATHCLFLDTPTLYHIAAAVVARLSLPPQPTLFPSILYFWHQTFWARRPQHNVNYSA